MKNLITNTFIFLVIISCSEGGSDDSESIIPDPPKPVAATLVFPIQNSQCTEGTNITPTNSTVLFKWNVSANTDSYELVLKNLNSGENTTHATTINEVSIELLRGIPYSWYVISKSNEVMETAISTTWKFYNAAEGFVSYAPFPAIAVAPENGSNIASVTSITLEWSASDVDNDIDFYDVYFGTVSTPAIFKTGHLESLLEDVNVTTATTYYWYVITKDKQGNSSNSEIFEFYIN